MRRSVLVLVVIVVAALAAGCSGKKGGPRAITWDREPCAHCHMLIGDPHTAAQLETASGEAPAFDDPGCLFAYVAERRPEVVALWFHHHTEDRWLRGDAAGFVPAHTPMGFGLVAVDKDAPGAISLAAAQARRAERTVP